MDYPPPFTHGWPKIEKSQNHFSEWTGISQDKTYIQMTSLQKGFSHREEAKTTKIYKKKFKNPKKFCEFRSFFFAIIKLPSRSEFTLSEVEGFLRGNKDVFAVDSLIIKEFYFRYG